ncbi:hypothetical protein TRFO_21619 [Tritrichomonas foetus]|uniref:Uncharacterized protein n=1 Tax=Tritrichomonas foetus TaxID=1144522 RepID=A0A1J4KHV8_9EUKA|nr:hypothetical protein TRFO_21619 [Tritrichomonas foetus]|eukprot:OHT09404.1 hypothetical protein TRFO_21619 [Tritrichomonas foetus]
MATPINRIKQLHTPPFPGAAQRGDIKHAQRHSNGHLPKKVGIILPELARDPGIRTPQYLQGYSQSYRQTYFQREPSTKDFDIDCVTTIRIGDPVACQYVQPCPSRIPELPAKTRARTAQSRSRPRSRAAYTLKVQKQEMPGLTMKYFGESGSVIGCFTSDKVPINVQRPKAQYASTLPRQTTTPSFEEITPRREEQRSRRIDAFLNLQ